ncbi:HAMP domain-containing histidine kinase [Catenovulum sp. SM1970]|uniref:sensor histidine kinase n=1 Tax=Marinifaba aquimaris TaxID=2741323 RepID=UPI0015737315|nr:HAMP domain-containing sensor histidine kinase [Marinifaba aquimaris]NTS78410.1 HAMP domain-containing histidine kinase [Marinifaba aquimaris]
MKISLYQKLALALVLLFLILTSLVLLWSQHLTSQTKAESEQRLHLALAEHLAQDNPLLAKGVYDYSALKNLFHTLMLLGPSFEFYYLDPAGKILTYSAEQGKVKRSHVDLSPIKHLIAGPDALPLYGDDPRNESGQKIFSVAPVYAQDEQSKQLQGYLYVIIGGEIHDNIFSSLKADENFKLQVSLALAALLFLLLVILGFIHYLTRPLKRLYEDMKAFKLGEELDSNRFVGWQNQPANEVATLGQGFYQMAEKINHQYQQLTELDKQRRELLADLSHDLRTPLASLQGYIETVALKGENLTEQQRQDFLNVSLKNACDLKKLIDQIFELAYLEGGQVKVSNESFDLTELLYDIKAKFALKSEQKQLSIEIEPAEINCLVNSDLAKVERILSNLIDNAIRHTKEQGQIKIIIDTESDNKVQISVADNGVGISEQEVDYIFDTRYRASNTQGKANHNAGLGLAITKKLVNLLNSDISVQSQLGKGTAFSFYLSPQN